MNSIKAKSYFAISAFLFFFILLIGFTFQTVDSQETDGMVINIAGRQRMLTQKMTKEMLYFNIEGIGKSDLEETMDLFENSLNDLINGNEELNIPKTENDLTIAKLNSVKTIWKNFKNNMNSVLNGDKSKADFIIDTNLNLLDNMNQAVMLFEEESKSKVERLKTIQLVFFFLQ